MCGTLRALYRHYPFPRLSIATDGESRTDRSTTLLVMRRIYASGVRATDAYSFPFLDVDPSWQPKWQPQPAFPRPRRGWARPDPYMYVSTRCRKRYRTEFCHNVDARRASNVLPRRISLRFPYYPFR